ncbi:cytoplasmic protein [Coprinopsis cinerea okayama7|uniref:Cytoplasmic protein n=1 Tax=Coprinopsis cinerea (strain Okayama-7 / 130 / ATCC MYA-4618 / FGSC 9003) TaxID=240176 RepID=A8NTL8_COPC7|nr:cytoplasmic protein [Coprinopsis cinerea okayama7\|eukprot:XP_001836263.2 cytoplasmic protein [Coprinopsis cinerea okayama7\
MTADSGSILKQSATPITVFTGFLGAGKTSIILSLLPRLPKDYKVVLLKNEFGDIEVDSKLAESSNLSGVNEILNGCMCCVLVGQMQSALVEIKDKFNPDRIIIECSGSAFPATLAFQIRQLEKDSNGGFKLDSIITVIDAENFTGYEDTSPTARMQASYSDIILINKWEHVSDRQLDIVMDHLHTLNDLTPKIRCEGRTGVDPSLIFGLDSQLFRLEEKEEHAQNRSNGHHHHDEVQTLTILSRPGSTSLSRSTVEKVLEGVSKEAVYRIKGFLRIGPVEELGGPDDKGTTPESDSVPKQAPGTTIDENLILNWAFGRWDFTPYPNPSDNISETIRLTVMGERGSTLRKAAKELAEALGAEVR